MPIIELKNATINYVEEGKGKDTIVFCHGLLWSHWMFHNQISHLKSKYRVIAFDFRGQGKSVAKDNKYDMDTLFDDAVDIIEKLCDKPVIFAGLSMGGYVGIALASKRPDLVKKLILMESTTDAETPESISKYKMLNNLVKTVGYWPVENSIMSIMFGKNFISNKDRKEDYAFFLKKLKENNRSTIVKATEGVINRKSSEDYLPNIKCKTLVLVGSQDVPCPVEKSEFLRDNIKNARLEIIEGAGHTGTLEEPQKYNKAISDFIEND
ncbi:alpha/beta hydrolase [Lacihabitans sp. LS3-19]|uniref:alpha/beta fold hydrolase n=1 Tax=Lacihabitans sp. LS3-19 TaxID=2487335 RepID=UPI0020CFE3DE|nr:alpha/beta hydrolase [Lacihabitans sp. LS3-19]MCP9769847.1 alpha/beta hydrolase [Lacihabitans sp. LS3-19]